MASERILNNYYNIGGFNKPTRIGYMMKMIRNLKPLTEEEWKIWYLSNIHNEDYLDNLAFEMQQSIPTQYDVSHGDCLDYIYDVMFRRTFLGYNKEKQALAILRDIISPHVKEAPEKWDTEYFIDFYVYGKNGELIGIQLKPETFYIGHYQCKVDIRGKMQAFCREQNAVAYVLKYAVNSENDRIIFSNGEVIDEIKGYL